MKEEYVKGIKIGQRYWNTRSRTNDYEVIKIDNMGYYLAYCNNWICSVVVFVPKHTTEAEFKASWFGSKKEMIKSLIEEYKDKVAYFETYLRSGIEEE